MNTRIVLVVVISFFPITFIFAQNRIIEETTIISGQDTPYLRIRKEVTHFDVSNQRPIFKIITDSIVDGITNTNRYYRYMGKDYEVFPHVSFREGYDTLQEYFSQYFWEKYSGNEINASCIYVILFNDKLKINDISIIIRSGYNNSHFDYDKLIKDFLYSTEGKWEITQESQHSKWYYVVGRVFIR
ncbi:MAG: hypothetical protein E7099_08035 [Mediterranea massiliensis]|nr:hypothetical protein [Mediterranea massiliensis]